jgi:hypothetical protein
MRWGQSRRTWPCWLQRKQTTANEGGGGEGDSTGAKYRPRGRVSAKSPSESSVATSNAGSEMVDGGRGDRLSKSMLNVRGAELVSNCVSSDPKGILFL